MKQTFRPFWLLALPIVLSFASCFTEDRPVAPDSGLAGKIQGKGMKEKNDVIVREIRRNQKLIDKAVQNGVKWSAMLGV